MTVFKGIRILVKSEWTLTTVPAWRAPPKTRVATWPWSDRPFHCLAHTTFVVLVALMTYCSSSLADIFEHTPPQRVIAGETLSLVLRLSSESPTETEISIVEPKANMTLTRMTRNKYMLRWHTPESMLPEQIISVQARNTGPPVSIEKHNIVIRSNKIKQPGLTTPSTIATPDKRLSVRNNGRYTKPRIKGIPTQIVSAGKVVKFKIFAPIESGDR